MVTLRSNLPWVLVLLLALAMAVTFAPWLRTGDARRSSHQTVRSAARLELVEGAPADLVRTSWPFVPLVACLGALALLLDRPTLGAALALVVGLALVALAIVVARAPDHADWGATGGLVVGPAVVVTSILLVSIVRPGGDRERS